MKTVRLNESAGAFRRNALVPSIALSVASLFAPMCALAETYYVGPGGSDDNAGTDRAAPLESIVTALAKEDVTKVVILEGDYTELAIVNTSVDGGNADYLGVLDKAVEVIGEKGPDKTILHCRSVTKSSTRRGGFFLNHADAVLSGVTVCDSNYGGSDWGQQGAALELRDGTATNCVFRDSRWTQTISGQPVATLCGGLLTDSFVTNNMQGANGKLTAGVFVKGGTLRRTVVANNSGGDIMVGCGLVQVGGTVQDCTISGNTTRREGGTFQAGGAYVAGGVFERNVVKGNTNVCVRATETAPTAGGIVIDRTVAKSRGWTCTGAPVVRNCLVVSNVTCILPLRLGYSAAGVTVAEATAVVTHLTVADNLSDVGLPEVTVADGTLKSSLSPHTRLLPVYQFGGTVENCVTDPIGPLFTADYHPRATSPLVGTIPAADDAETTDDKDGVARASDKARTPGCYEPTPVASDELAAEVELASDVFRKGATIVMTAKVYGKTTVAESATWTVMRDGVAVTPSVEGLAATIADAPCGVYSVTLDATASGGEAVPAVVRPALFRVLPDKTYVSNAGTGTWPFDEPGKATNDVQAAVDAVYGASDFTGTVSIAASTYKLGYDKTFLRSVQVNRPVALVGPENPEAAVLNYQRVPRRGGGLLLAHPGAWASGLTLTGISSYPGEHDVPHGQGIHLVAGVVSNCVLTGSNGRSQNGINSVPLAVLGGLATHCTITNNLYTEAAWGRSSAGAYVVGGVLEHSLIAGNRFESNADHQGAGGLVQNGGIVRDTIIRDNVQANKKTYLSCAAGGAVILGGLFERNIVTANRSAYTGNDKYAAGGISINGAATVRNCLVVGNSSSVNGEASAGGVVVANSSARVDHLTIYGNSGTVTCPGGFYAASGCGAALRGSIVYENSGGGQVSVVSGTPTYSCFAEAASYSDAGNVATNPVFASPTSYTAMELDFSNANAYEIKRSSPCRDAVGAVLAADDLLGRLRPGEISSEPGANNPDMGAFELPASDPGALFVSVNLEQADFATGTFKAGVYLEGDHTNIVKYVWTVTGGAGATEYETATGTLSLPAIPCGSYTVSVRVTNDQTPAETATSDASMFRVRPTVAFVATDGKHVWPYADLANAATNLLDAVNAVYSSESQPGTVRVADGDYTFNVSPTYASRYYLVVLEQPIRIIGNEAEPDRVVIRYPTPATAIAAGGICLMHAKSSVSGVTLSGGSRIPSEPSEQQYRQEANAFQLMNGTVSNCVVRDWFCKGQTQSAIYVADGLLADTSVTALKTTNNPWGRGVLGIAVDGGEVVRCRVHDMSYAADYSDKMRSGGLWQKGGYVHDCTFSSLSVRGNENVVSGGGAIVEGGRLENCSFFACTNRRTNVSSPSAGGIAVGGAASIVNCLVTQCRVTIDSDAGAGGLCLATSATGAGVTNLTVYANACSYEGGPAAARLAAGTVANTSFWTDGTDGEVAVSGATLDHCSTANPLFRKPEAGDYSPRASSPLFCGGRYAEWMSSATDLVGRPRATEGHKVDIGCCQATKRGGLSMIVR